jgi:hypothetical protein
LDGAAIARLARRPAKLPWPTAIEKADLGDLFSSINQEREISVFTSLGAD